MRICLCICNSCCAVSIADCVFHPSRCNEGCWAEFTIRCEWPFGRQKMHKIPRDHRTQKFRELTSKDQKTSPAAEYHTSRRVELHGWGLPPLADMGAQQTVVEDVPILSVVILADAHITNRTTYYGGEVLPCSCQWVPHYPLN